MTTRPTISAVVIVYNGLRFLPECLQTLSENLAEFDHELILVDNNSTDGSREFIETEYRSARLIANPENYLFARAVNQGIEASSGEYLHILNQDLRFRPGATRLLYDRLVREPELGMIGPGYVYFDGISHGSVRAFPTFRHVFYRALLLDRLFPNHREFGNWRMGWFDHSQEQYVDQPMGAVMMIPRTVLDDIGLMDESFPLLFNDVDLCRRMSEGGYKRLYYPKATVEHYVGASTSRRPYRLKMVSHFSLYRYLKKYARWYEYPLLWLAGLFLIGGLFPLMAISWLRRALRLR